MTRGEGRRDMATERDRTARRERQVAKLDAQLDAWAAKLSALLTHAVLSGNPHTAGFRVRLNGLHARKTAMRARVARFEATGNQTWGAFKAAIASDWQDLALAFDDLG